MALAAARLTETLSVRMSYMIIENWRVLVEVVKVIVYVLLVAFYWKLHILHTTHGHLKPSKGGVLFNLHYTICLGLCL